MDEVSDSDQPSQSRNTTRTTVELQGEKISPPSPREPIHIHVEKRHNLSDPLLDLDVTINNPIDRLWKAIQKLWKSQKTVIALRFTIPLLVLPIALFVGYRLWQGTGVHTPFAKVGFLRQVTIQEKPEYLLILPNTEVYRLSFTPDSLFPPSLHQSDPVIVFGMLNHAESRVVVESLSAYSSDSITNTPITINSSSSPRSLLQFLSDSLWSPFSSFLSMFE